MEEFLIDLIPANVEETTRRLAEAGVVDRALCVINHPDYVHHTGVRFGSADCQAWVMYSPRIGGTPAVVTLAILTRDEDLHTFETLRRWDICGFRQLGEEPLDDSQLAVINELAEEWKCADPHEEWANFPPVRASRSRVHGRSIVLRLLRHDAQQIPFLLSNVDCDPGKPTLPGSSHLITL